MSSGACRVDQQTERTLFRLLSQTTILIVLIALAAGRKPAAQTAALVPPVLTPSRVPRSATPAPAPQADMVASPAAKPVLPTRTPAPSSGVPTTAVSTAGPATRPAVVTATPESGAVVDRLIDTVADLGTAGQFAGAVLIAKDGTPVYMAAYGLASRPPDVSNQTDTKFNLGSMDKMFTAIAILQLIEQGKLSLDGVIRDYWPDYPNQHVASEISIHHLLIHTAGMGDCFEGGFFTTPRDQLRSWKATCPCLRMTLCSLRRARSSPTATRATSSWA